MPQQRYERVRDSDDGEHESNNNNNHSTVGSSGIPNSPPPSFSSRPNSPEPDETTVLTESFDLDSDDDSDDDGEGHDTRNIRSEPSTRPAGMSSFPVPTPVTTSSSGARRIIGNAGSANDGVFANLSAKPSKTTEKPNEEHPPTYEQAAADAPPPFWETMVIAPGMSPDEVYIDGLPVGSVFGFVWNAMISLSFQFVGFLLTYLLHTTHAAKNGSRAGLGITLVQYGFYMRSSPILTDPVNPSGNATPESFPSNPNAIADIANGALPTDNVSGGAGDVETLGRNEWLSYILMVVGWFILIRAISDFLRARRTEQVVLASPDRGLGYPIIAEGEAAEHSV